jgi:hypothetical protein
MSKQTTLHPRDDSATIEKKSPIDSALEHIGDALRGLRYGTVSIIVQDGVVIQIDRTERRRLR